MLSKNEVNFIKQLSGKKNKTEDAVFIAEGEKLVSDLLQSGMELERLYFTSGIKNEALKALKIAKKIEESYMQRITNLKTASPCLALFKKKPTTLVAPITGDWILALDDIQDPGNLGTIVRVADWFGIKNIICNEHTVDVYNTKAIQASMGSIARVNLAYANLDVFLNANKKLPIYATVLNGDNILQINSFKPGIIIVGNEGKGIKEGLLKYATKNISLPRLGGAESLNAAMATGIILSRMIY